MRYELTVRLEGDRTDAQTLEGFEALSKAIDLAWKVPGFKGYVVSPA